MSIGRYFKKISIIDDIYLRYIQFRTLHRRLYTNNILHKIGIKDSEMCSLCKTEKDFNEHMLILCEVSRLIWTKVESWIREIGIDEYTITDEIIFWGELNGSYWVNAIILNTKKCIFLAKIRETKPSLFHIKASARYMHNYEKFSFQMKNKEHIFTRRWGIYTNNLDT